MSKSNNYKRKVGVAIALLSTLLGGNISSAKDMNHVSNQNVRLSQTTRKADETSIASKKLFKAIIAMLIGTGLGGFAIWGLTRNKKESDTPKKDDNNKDQITKEKEIEEHNKKLICDAIELAKQENKLHCDENSLRDAMFELFDRLAKLEYKGEAWGIVLPLWEFFHEKKMAKIIIEEFPIMSKKNLEIIAKRNFVALYLDSSEEIYNIIWLPDNKVSIGFYSETLSSSFNQTFENLKPPFEINN